MARFTVVRSDGTSVDSPVASDYLVEDDGALVVRLAGVALLSFEAGGWIEIVESAPSLTPMWPPSQLDDLLDGLHTDLCGWGFCDPLGPAHLYASPEFNDLETFSAALLAKVGIGRHSVGDHRPLVARLHARIAAVLASQPR